MQIKTDDITNLVSIVIPSYNRISYLKEAIASVIAQTHTNWELLIVDDGSTDGSSEAIKAIDDKRINLFELSHTGNIAALRNAGARAARGKWLSFLDSDDLWLPRKLELQLDALNEKNKRWSYGRFELMDPGGQTLPDKTGSYQPASGWIAADIMNCKASVAIGSLIIERKLFEALGGFNTRPELIYREDFELVLRLALKAEGLGLDDLLLRIREHQGRSTNMINDGHERAAFLYGHLKRSFTDPKLIRAAKGWQAYHLAETAGIRLRQRHYRKAAGHLFQSIVAGDKWRHLFSVVRKSIKAK